jgi:hypothetical protein
LLTAWWLRRGEAALWSMLRWLHALTATSVVAVLAALTALAALVALLGARRAPATPRWWTEAWRVRLRPRHPVLRHVVIRRGPPSFLGTPVMAGVRGHDMAA